MRNISFAVTPCRCSGAGAGFWPAAIITTAIHIGMIFILGPAIRLKCTGAILEF